MSEIRTSFDLNALQFFALFKKEGYKARKYTVSESVLKFRESKSNIPSREKMIELYVEKKLKVNKILEILKISGAHFYKYLKIYGIEKRSPHLKSKKAA